MEFNFQSINQRSSSSSAFFSSSSPSPLPPHPNPFLNHPHHHHHDIYPNYPLLNHPLPQHSSSSPYFSPFFIPPPFPIPPPFLGGFDTLDMRRTEIMQREIEKERIRAEILAEEIMRRRVLEEEVRREIMIERDRFLRYGSTQIDSRVPLLRSFEETERFGAGFSTWRETRCEGSELPFQRSPRVNGIRNGNGEGSSCGVTLRENKSIDKEANKEKVIILAKPNVDSTDVKRKITPASGVDVEVKSVSVKKQKTEGEWSCALCQVTTPSERVFNEHLQGKKHLAREKGLVTQKVGFGVSPKPNAPNKTTANSSQKSKSNEGGKSSKTKVHENPTQKTPTTEKLVSDEQKSVEKSTRPEKNRRWCDICKVEAHTRKAMKSHKRGKRHLANLQKSNQTSDPDMEKKSRDTTMEETKAPDLVNVVLKQGTDTEAEIKEVDSDMPQTDDKDKAVDDVADDGIAKHGNV